jgi:hypothetical protein
MLPGNKHLENLILKSRFHRGDLNFLTILKAVAQHDSLRHLEISFYVGIPISNLDEWKEVFSQIGTRLTSFKSSYLFGASDTFAPLVNAKFLTTLQLIVLPSSETFRQMADNYTCLQNFDLLGSFYEACYDFNQNSDMALDMAYFIEKQCETLTSLKICALTWDTMTAISKCRNLKKLDLSCHDSDVNLDILGILSNLRNLFLRRVNNCDLGHIIEAAKFQHLNEIGINAVNLTDNDISQISRTYGQQV